MNRWLLFILPLAYIATTAMQVSLTIIRYRKLFIPVAFFAMAVHRLPLWLNKKISFYKLLGCGKNGTFDKIPDLQQWGILTVRSLEFEVRSSKNSSSNSFSLMKDLYGSFIANWIRLFGCETFTILLEPLEGHGYWDGKEVFGNLPRSSAHEGMVAILTRATIRLNKLKYFWQHVAAVSAKMKSSKGFIASIGIGEIPWIKQATFSIWEDRNSMMDFAYGMKEHTEVIRKTRQEKWYSEDMFVRFKIIKHSGTLHGKDPLKRKL